MIAALAGDEPNMKSFSLRVLVAGKISFNSPEIDKTTSTREKQIKLLRLFMIVITLGATDAAHG